MHNRLGIVFLILIACYAAIISKPKDRFNPKDRAPIVTGLIKVTTAPAVPISTGVSSDPVPEIRITPSLITKASTAGMGTTVSSIAIPAPTKMLGRISVFHIPPVLREKFLILAIELCHRKVKRGKGSDFFACSTDLETKISTTLNEYVFEANHSAKSKLTHVIKHLIGNGIAIPANISIEYLEKENQTQPLTITVAPNFAKTTATTTTRSSTSLPFSRRSRSSMHSKLAINCWLYTGTPAISGSDKGPSDSKELPKRERNTGAHELQRRLQKQISQIGKCPQLLKPPLKRRPPYKGLKQVMNEHGGLPQAQWWFIPHQITSHGGGCDVAVLQHVGRRDAKNGNPGKNNRPVGYSGPGAIKRLSVDHVFEISILQTFFLSIFNTTSDPRCRSFIETFNKPDKSPNAGGRSRFDLLWGHGANKVNLALVGLDQNVNSVKGKLFNPNLEDLQKDAFSNPANPEDTAWVDRNLNLWNDLGMAMMLLHLPNIAAQFKKVNGAIYEAFRAFDEIQSRETPQETAQWAEMYKSFMPSFLSVQGSAIESKVSSITAAIAIPSITADSEGNLNAFGKAFERMAVLYHPREAFSFPQEMMLDFPTTTIADIRKRAAPTKSLPSVTMSLSLTR